MSAAILMSERGVEATSFSEVVAHSGAPRGSIYHHFPGGKTELIAEATQFAGEALAGALVAALAADDPLRAIREFNGAWVARLRDSDYAAGCPIVAATLEGDRTPAASEAAGRVFARWEALLAEGIRPHLTDPDRATSIATITVAAIEGAVVLARAQRSSAPLERVGRELEKLLAAAL